MATFGETLRRERELRGITLPELSNATKITLRYLRALENNQFERLPGGVFNRGFVRAVARYMRLDENHWVGEYVRAAHEEPEIVARYAPPVAKPAQSHMGVWSLAILVVAFGVSAYVVHEIRAQRAADAAQAGALRSSPDDVQAAEKSSAQHQPALAADKAAETLAPASASPSISPASALTTPPDAAGVGTLRLQVDVMEEAWLNIQVDGDAAYSGVMHRGESRSFRGDTRIELATGNASAVVLTLNGETLPPLGNPGEVKRITLTAKDLRPPIP